MYQPDIFELYMRSEQTRQTRQFFPQGENSTSSIIKVQSQNPINTQIYQPNQMQIEIPLPFYLQMKLQKTNLQVFHKNQMQQIHFNCQ